GEVYDARKEIKGWNTVGFDDKSWKESLENDGPGGRLQKTYFPPVQITDIIRPVSISQMEDERYIVDMGVNFTGHYRIHLKGEPGDTITFRIKATSRPEMCSQFIFA
ncbi:family 78 glycoside hydrolase catalytic domain, partial [bacterium]